MNEQDKPNGEDQIGQAVAAVEGRVDMAQWQVVISSTGRPAVAALPVDATDAEIAEFAGWLLTYVLTQYRARRLDHRKRIVLARSVPPA